MASVKDYLPNLFIPGAAKSGTSTLHEYLSHHPDIHMSVKKEPNYFSRTDKGIENYSKLFSGHIGTKYLGDASAAYMALPDVARKIESLVADPRFIFVLRNPVDRAWSHYWWARGRHGKEKGEFRAAFTRDIDEVPVAISFQEARYDKYYFQLGLYGKWLETYYDIFDRSSILILNFEEMIASPVSALEIVCEFLQIPRFQEIPIIQSNSTRIVRFPGILKFYNSISRNLEPILGPVLPGSLYNFVVALNSRFIEFGTSVISGGRPPKLRDEDRKWIAPFYVDDLKRLKRITGVEYQGWRKDFFSTPEFGPPDNLIPHENPSRP